MTHPFQDLYDQIPAVECKGHCGTERHDTCCGPIICTALEAERLDAYDGVASPWESGTSPGTVRMDRLKLNFYICPHLGLNGRCTAYEARPLICRLWGAVENLRCPWGCRPKKYLTCQQAAVLIEEAERRNRKYLELPNS